MAMTLEQALARFGVVTVMEPTFQALKKVNGSWVDDINFSTITLDSLRISNFTMEGPTKTSKGGLNAETIFRYGKTARLEMEDVVGRIEVIKQMFGGQLTQAAAPSTTTYTTVVQTTEQKVFELPEVAASTAALELLINGATVAATLDPTLKYVIAGTTVAVAGQEVIITYTRNNYDKLAITEKFPTMFRIAGRTFVIAKDDGSRQFINIHINRFLPDGLLNLTMEAEGDFGVFNVAGELFTNDCGIFYEFSDGVNPSACS